MKTHIAIASITLTTILFAGTQSEAMAETPSESTTEPSTLTLSNDQPAFTFELATEAQQRGGSSQREARSENSSQLSVDAVKVENEWAVVDSTLVRSADEGATYAASREYVDVAWAPIEGAIAYRVVVDGADVYPTATTALRFAVSPGAASRHHVQILPTAKLGDELSLDAPIYGLQVFVPESSAETDEESATRAANELVTLASGPFNTTSIVWRTFIPSARIDAPTLPGAPCDYGAGYEFDGNNRGYSTSDFGDWSSKTQLTASIFWGNQNAFDGSGFVSPSSVYNKSTGQHIETRSVTGAMTEVTKLGHTADTTDVRFRLKAGIPYCDMNSIQGAFTISVTRTGAYTIPSGSHRQMPNHEVLINSSWTAGGTVQYAQAIAYRRDLLDPLCLVGTWACAEATMSGTAGTY